MRSVTVSKKSSWSFTGKFYRQHKGTRNPDSLGRQRKHTPFIQMLSVSEAKDPNSFPLSRSGQFPFQSKMADRYQAMTTTFWDFTFCWLSQEVLLQHLGKLTGSGGRESSWRDGWRGNYRNGELLFFGLHWDEDSGGDNDKRKWTLALYSMTVYSEISVQQGSHPTKCVVLQL